MSLERAPDSDSHRGDLWFARSGTTFRHELVEASVYADGDESFLTITYFGTPFPLETLYTEGLSGRAAGRYLFQEDLLERPGESALPQNIPVDERIAVSPIGLQLRQELHAADAKVFPRLRMMIEADGEWWPGQA